MTLLCGYCKASAIAIQGGMSVCEEHFEKYTKREVVLPVGGSDHE